MTKPTRDATPANSTLIVYVPSMVNRPSDYKALLDRLRAEIGIEGAVWVYPRNIRRASVGTMKRHCADFADILQQYWSDSGRQNRRILLIGHSVGGLIVRGGYLHALENEQPMSWAKYVDRIVLLGSPNIGVDIQRISLPLRWLTHGAVWLLAFKGLTALELIRGSAFITNLRLQWIRRVANAGDDTPMVVQIDGAADPLLEPEDSRDIEGLPRSARITLPAASHRDLPCIEGVHEDFPGQRWTALRNSVFGEVCPTLPQELPARERAYASITFVLHGIRSGNDTWVDQLRQQLESEGGPSIVKVVPASYGYFSAYNFAIPFTRRSTLRWFQDRYSFEVARHPNLPLHFVGHSNGTYMLGQSLRAIPEMQFQRVYLAGSVLPRAFPWPHLTNREQLTDMVNVCATKDKPVGWLCSGLRGVGAKDIGVGGLTGFDEISVGRQYRSIPGGHGAALCSENLPAIAQYISRGEINESSGLQSPKGWFMVLSRTAPYMAPIVVLLTILGIGWSVVTYGLAGVGGVLAVIGFIYLILKVI